MRVARQPFIAAYQRSELSSWELAERMGYMRKRGKRVIPDTSRALRTLGLKREGASGYVRGDTISYDLGVKLCRALDLDPVDVGV